MQNFCIAIIKIVEILANLVNMMKLKGVNVNKINFWLKINVKNRAAATDIFSGKKSSSVNNAAPPTDRKKLAIDARRNLIALRLRPA